MNAATGWADRLSISAETGGIRRELDGPLLRTQPQVFPNTPAVFRNSSSETKWYGSAKIGVKITEHFSLRAGYQDFGNTYVRFITPPHILSILPPPENFRFRDRAFTLDPVFTWKVGTRVTAYAFWGVAFNEADVTLQDYPLRLTAAIPSKSSKTTQSRIGAGADIQLNSHLSLRAGADYQRFSSFTKEGWLAHAGLAYAF